MCREYGKFPHEFEECGPMEKQFLVAEWQEHRKEQHERNEELQDSNGGVSRW